MLGRSGQVVRPLATAPTLEGMAANNAVSPLLISALLVVIGLIITIWVGRLTRTLAACLTSLGLHLALSAYLLYSLGLTALGTDASDYHQVAVAVADSFSGIGHSVTFSEGKEGWIFVLGFLYYLFGSHAEIGLIVISTLMALVPAILASASRNLGWASSAQTSAWVAVLLPSLIIWPSSLLREGPSIFLLSLMVLSLGFYHSRKLLTAGLLLLGATAGMMWIRPPIGAAAVIGIAVGVILTSWRGKTGPLGMLVYLAPSALALPFGLIRGNQFDLGAAGALRENLSFGATTTTGATGEGWDTLGGAVRGMIQDLPGAAFGPYPWQAGGQPLPLIVDGLTFIVLAGLAFVALRNRTTRNEAFTLILPAIGVLMVVAAAFGNYGFVVRQRSQAAAFIVPVAAAGWVLYRNRRANLHSPATSNNEQLSV